ncbi:MAG TPA: chemotaxis protein CheW [Rhizomicrobium sp.]|nr:chemotaxis protein CheW [Rhizomicrobium sp.]
MNTETLASPASRGETDADAFVTFTVAGQLFGVPVTRVQDILIPDDIAPVPGGPPEVRGLINLRGRIVTVIDMRKHLSLPMAQADGQGMCVTVESRGESYTLYVDSVGDVVTLSRSVREGNPATLDAVWRNIADAVYRTDRGLLVALHVDRLLAIETEA